MVAATLTPDTRAAAGSVWLGGTSYVADTNLFFGSKSVAFCEGMLDASVPPAERLALLRAACKAHGEQVLSTKPVPAAVFGSAAAQAAEMSEPQGALARFQKKAS